MLVGEGCMLLLMRKEEGAITNISSHYQSEFNDKGSPRPLSLSLIVSKFMNWRISCQIAICWVAGAPSNQSDGRLSCLGSLLAYSATSLCTPTSIPIILPISNTHHYRWPSWNTPNPQPTLPNSISIFSSSVKAVVSRGTHSFRYGFSTARADIYILHQIPITITGRHISGHFNFIVHPLYHWPSILFPNVITLLPYLGPPYLSLSCLLHSVPRKIICPSQVNIYPLAFEILFPTHISSWADCLPPILRLFQCPGRTIELGPWKNNESLLGLRLDVAFKMQLEVDGYGAIKLSNQWDKR